MRRQVSGVYFRPEAAYVVSSAWTVNGLLIDHEPVIRLERDAPFAVLGTAVLQALNATEMDVPEPEDRQSIIRPLLRAVGFRTWGAFTQGALYLGMNYDGMVVEIIPSAAKGRGAFDYRGDKAARCQPEPGPVGQLVYQQLTLCTDLTS